MNTLLLIFEGSIVGRSGEYLDFFAGAGEIKSTCSRITASRFLFFAGGGVSGSEVRLVVVGEASSLESLLGGPKISALDSRTVRRSSSLGLGGWAEDRCSSK